jgi:ABC-type antimicrobial peptide transport system permease subunit
MAFVSTFLSFYVDLVLRPYPGFEQSSRIATIGQVVGLQVEGPGRIGIPHEIMERIAEEMSSVEAAASVGATNVLIGTERDQAAGAMVSEQFFSGLRPRLALGRGFGAEDHAPDAEPVVVLSRRYWQQRFDSDPNIIGSFVEISRNPSNTYQGPPGSFASRAEPEQESARFRIVGVAADGVEEVAPFDPAVWLPLERVWSMFAGVSEALPFYTAAGDYVRRKPGVSAANVAEELRVRYGGAGAFRGQIPGSRLDAIGGIVGDFGVQRAATRQLQLFLGTSILVALVAAANVSLFLLARAPGRSRELGIRMAVGAPLRRLARQLITEGALLVLVSTGLGLLVSIWLSLYLKGLAFLRDANWRDVTLLDWRVLGLCGVVMLVLTLLVSLAPVPGLWRIGIAASSREVAARASWPQRLAGTVQIAIAGTLGAAAIAFGWHLGALAFGDPGYKTANLFVVDDAARVAGSREEMLVELARRREAIESIPGVTAVAFGNPVPGARPGNIVPFPVQIPYPDDPVNSIEAYTGSVDEQFIDLLGLHLLYGRSPEPDEIGSVVVNQTLARAFWGRDDVVGERLPRFGPLPPEGAQVVGVLQDLSYEHPSAAVPAYVFVAIGGQSYGMTTLVEAELSAKDLKVELAFLEAIGEIEFEVGEVRPLELLRLDMIPADRARGYLTIASAIVVVFLAAVGFYGTQRFLVSAGRREYAIRASLGAGPRALRRLVFGRGLLLGLPGIIVGGLLAFIVVAYLRGDVVSRDIAPGLVAVCMLAGLVLLILAASVGPARHAGRTQPASLLRED